MNKVLIRIDKNGTKYWADDTCQRCGGRGERDEWYYTGKVCFECGGTGHSRWRHWKEYTPEYAEKLEARRQKREAEKRAKWEAEHAEEIAAQKRAQEEFERAEAERKAQEAERKARSDWYGTEGDKVEFEAVYEGSPHYQRRDPFGNVETVYIHRFRIDNKLLVWRTTSFRGFGELEEGTTVKVKGTIKEHTEYKDEKQTALLRCKVTRAGA